MKKIGLGIIGLGFIGKMHLQNGLRLKNAYVAGVADMSPKALASAKKSGITNTFKNYADLLKDSSVDCVVIALPNHLHLQCARMAAESNKVILLEKPIARSVDEAKEILSVTRRNGVRLMMGYPMRFNPVYRGLKEQIGDGSLGDVEVVHAINVTSGPFFSREEMHAPVPVPDWWFNKELTGGGVLIDLGCHLINLLRWYFGDIIDVKGSFTRRFKMPFEDTAVCLATFESGTLGMINVGWFSQEVRMRIELLGSVKDAVVTTPPSNPALTAIHTLTEGISRNRIPFLNELQHFVNCQISDKPFISSGEDGLKDLEAIHKAYQNEIRLQRE
jgi:predicted dehydrogenase